MENMKAVQVHNYGGPEVLRFEDAPRPAPVEKTVLGAFTFSESKMSSKL
jgi:NADPH:quinone reductase-like Zn-dependent oxidoreductase